MSDYSLTINGADELKQHLLDNAKLSAVKDIVKSNGAGLQQQMVNKAQFKKGYSTGATRRGITTSFENGGLTVRTGPHTHYSGYLEKGTRKMAAQPFVKPAFDIQKVKFKKDLEGIFK